MDKLKKNRLALLFCGMLLAVNVNGEEVGALNVSATEANATVMSLETQEPMQILQKIKSFFSGIIDDAVEFVSDNK